jgi:putative flippase GtrA
VTVLGPTRRPPVVVLQLARFGLVGATNTAITLAAYAALVTLGAPAVAAAIASWTAGAANGYRLNRAWTFRCARRGDSFAGARYAAVQGLGAAVDALALTVLVGDAHLPRLAGEVVALPPATVLTFVLCRRWVFPAREPVAV